MNVIITTKPGHTDKEIQDYLAAQNIECHSLTDGFLTAEVPANIVSGLEQLGFVDEKVKKQYR